MVRRFARVVIGLLLVVGCVVGAILASSLTPRVVRRNPELLSRGIVGKWNDINRKSAGTRLSPFALLHHVGRRSGRTFQTPLGAHPYGDGFVVPLTYGTTSDWYQNVAASGTCTLTWKGRSFQFERPEIVSGPDVAGAWPALQRIAMRGARVQEFVWLHESPQPA
ncbi:MAG TPA: nitroreductase family deazaflavin-dependent oxidoreductase [Mycobacterium sp.]|nr:nitroreductase family deazaflavin-dependent oxidoreductase [Mycobacterium sp.]